MWDFLVDFWNDWTRPMDWGYALDKLISMLPLIGLVGFIAFILGMGMYLQRKDLKGRYRSMRFTASDKQKRIIADGLVETLDKAMKDSKVTVREARRLYMKLSYVLMLPDDIRLEKPKCGQGWCNWLKKNIRLRISLKIHTPVNLPDRERENIVTLKRSSGNVTRRYQRVNRVAKGGM